MATLTIRKLDDGVHSRLREQARSNNRSLEAEVREILAARAMNLPALVADLRSFHADMADRGVALSDSVALVRAVRDE